MRVRSHSAAEVRCRTRSAWIWKCVLTYAFLNRVRSWRYRTYETRELRLQWLTDHQWHRRGYREVGPSPSPCCLASPESFDSGGLSARRWLPSPELDSLSKFRSKSGRERERGLDELRVRVLRLHRCGVLLAIDGVRIFARRGRHAERRAVDR